MPLLLPKGKKRAALLGKLKEIFRVSRSQPVGGVIEKINPILRGWVKYFAIGHSSRCFCYIRYWVETRIRRHLARACPTSTISSTRRQLFLPINDNYSLAVRSAERPPSAFFFP
jgi:hypothetical protein